MKRKEAVERFLSQFEGDVWDASGYVDLADLGLRITWTCKGPDDVEAGICFIDNEGNFMMKSLNHLWFDDKINLDVRGEVVVRPDAWESPNIEFSEEDSKKIQEFIGGF